MTAILPTLALALLIWLALAVLVAAAFHVALGPRREEKAYRRFER
jgi:hypothetical protein